MFPTRIVVGVDGTRASEYALDAARELSTATGSELRLVHVKLTRSSLRGRPMTPALRETLEQEGASLLDRMRKRVEGDSGVVAGTHLRFGDRVERELVRAQAELGADLLVIAASRSGSLAQRLFGSGPTVAPAGTVRAASGSVLVVREPAGSG
jgi:nucleotide-binding universal stress UspA family protein